MLEFREVTSRLRENTQHWSRWSRWTLFLVPIGILAIGLTWWAPSLENSSVDLMDGQPLSDAQQRCVIKALSKANLDGFTLENRCLYVPGREVTRYLLALAEHDALPKSLQESTLDAVETRGLFESKADFEARMRVARERDLAAAICEMEGIQDASVQFDELEERGLQKRRVISASVVVLPEPGKPLEFARVATIRRLVAAAKAGLEPQDVHVTDLRSGSTIPVDDPDAIARYAAEAWLQHKQSLETYWEEKLESSLRFISHVEVTVDVELPGPDARDSSSSDEKSEAGTPFPMRPQGLNVLVAVPRSYLLDIWEKRHRGASERQTGPPPTESLNQLQAETAERIQQAVTSLTRSRSTTTESNVTVTTFDDLKPATKTWSTIWSPKWTVRQQMGMAIAALGVIGFVTAQWTGRRRRRRRMPDLCETAIVDPPLAEVGGPSTVPIPFPEVDEQQLRANLTDLVREDPEQAAKILNQWIARAG